MMSPVTGSSSSPTIVQPAGAPQHGPIVLPIQLTKHNYLLWKSSFIPILKAYDMLNLAEGREQCPPQFLTGSSTEEDPAYTSWINRDQIFLIWINASLPASLLRYTIDYTSGRALWLHLENYLAKNATSRVLELKARLHNLAKYRYWGIESYLDIAKEIADELEAVGFPVDDGDLVSHILEGLLQNQHYEDLVASIRNRPKPVTRQQLHALLLRHEIPLSTKEKTRCISSILCRVLLVLVLTSLLFHFILFKR